MDSDRRILRSMRKAGGPINTSTPKMESSLSKNENPMKDMRNISFESDHTDPSSRLSPLLPKPEHGEHKMTHSPSKKSVSHATPSIKKVKKRNSSSRRSSRSRSRGRSSRRSTPVKNILPPSVTEGPQSNNQTDLAKNVPPVAKRRPIRSNITRDLVPFEDHSAQTPTKFYGASLGAEKSRKLSLPGSGLLAGHPYILYFFRLLMFLLYVVIICKVITVLGADRFVLKHWHQWAKKNRPNASM